MFLLDEKIVSLPCIFTFDFLMLNSVKMLIHTLNKNIIPVLYGFAYDFSMLILWKCCVSTYAFSKWNSVRMLIHTLHKKMFSLCAFKCCFLMRNSVRILIHILCRNIVSLLYALLCVFLKKNSKKILIYTRHENDFSCVHLGLGFLFNGISTLVGYLMPKPFS